MANSVRKRILNYVRDTVFAAITTGGGYNTSPVTRLRGLKQVDSMPDSAFPALFVSRVAEDRDNLTSNQYKGVMKVILVGYVKSSTGIDGMQEQLDDLIEDLTKALEQDRKMGGLCKWLEIKNIISEDDDASAFAAFVMSVEVVYVTEGVTP